MVDVIYQYKLGPATWQELIYSLRSLEANLKDEFRVWIVGDMHPGLAEIKHIKHTIPHEKRKKIPRTNCYDSCSKMELVINHPEVGERFMYMYDDIYLLNPITFDEIAEPRAMGDFTNANWNSLMNGLGTPKWWKLLRQTLDILRRFEKPQYNYESHCPRVFEKDKMKRIFKLYNPKEFRYLFTTLYFNHYFLQPDVIKDNGSYKMAEYMPSTGWTAKQYQGEMEQRMVLNHNDRGLTDELKIALAQKFYKPSRFEQ